MDPNQQPQNQNQGGYSPQPGQVPPAQPEVYPNSQQQPAPAQQQYQPQPQQYQSQQQPQPAYAPDQPHPGFGPQAQSTHQQGYGPQPQAPAQPGFGPQPTPTYAVDYLEQIAPPPARAKFLSGGFGKIVIGLGVLMVLAVSLIVAVGGTNKTADLELLAIKLDNAQKVATDVKRNIKDEKLSSNNTDYMLWITNTDRGAYDLLGKAGVAKKDFDKKTVAAQAASATALTAKFTDARLNANLDSVYAREMAYQTKLLKTSLDTMSKKSQSKAIRDFAKTASNNLATYQKSFAEFKPDAP